MGVRLPRYLRKLKKVGASGRPGKLPEWAIGTSLRRFSWSHSAAIAETWKSPNQRRTWGRLTRHAMAPIPLHAKTRAKVNGAKMPERREVQNDGRRIPTQIDFRHPWTLRVAGMVFATDLRIPPRGFYPTTTWSCQTNNVEQPKDKAGAAVVGEVYIDR